MNLKELIQKSNQLVKEQGKVVHDFLSTNNVPGTVSEIIQLIKSHEDQIEKPSDEDYTHLANALNTRREISLKASYIALLSLLQPQDSLLKILDKHDSNLQLEKEPSKEIPMSEELSQEEIEALLAGNTHPTTKTKAAIEEDLLTNNDIEALLEQAASQKPTATGKTPVPKQNETFSQTDIEALLAGEANKTPEISNEDQLQLSNDDIEKLLSSVDEKEDRVSEDDIQALMNAQAEQDHIDPLANLINQETPSTSPKASIKETNDNLSESNFEQTNIPQDVFSEQDQIHEDNIQEILNTPQNQPQEPNPTQVISQNIIEKVVADTKESTPIPIITTPTSSHSNTLAANEEVKERILNDQYALYVNNGGKPTLHGKYNSQEEIKKAYLQAMQNFPQNALFIEKISRKEIIIVKETKEIVNLKINISFS